MNEVWKDIVGYEGHYQVSNLGRVKSIKFGKEKILKPHIVKGYKQLELSLNNIKRMSFVHRLVAEAFISNPNHLPLVNHKDENTYNNNVSNLEWCDSSYNNNYGLRNTKVAEKLSRQVFQYDKNLTLIAIWKSSNECGRNGFKQSHINNCCNGKRKTHKGFIWSYNELKPQAV